MHISRRHTRALGLSAAALLASTAHASDIIDSLSFGHRGDSISVNHRHVDHWHLSGLQHTPDLLSDRVILTPPYPGNKRGAIWTAATVPAAEWQVEMKFRSTGPERGGGNLQVWYAKHGNTEVGTNSLYTIDTFDGLMLEIDQYGGRGGSIRGFLNDGTKHYKGQNVDQLSFGHCDYSYRNLGRFSKLGMKHTANGLTVTIDDKECFTSDKVVLPTYYEFGVTAASAESPDSFEISSFETRTIAATGHQDYYAAQHEYAETHQHQQQNAPAAQPSPPSQKIQESQQKGRDTFPHPGEMPDVLASSIRSQESQFEDLHNRLQGLQHQINTIFTQMQTLSHEAQQAHTDLVNRLIPMHERLNEAANARPRLEDTVNMIKHDIEGRDYKDLLDGLTKQVHFGHSNLMETLPRTMDTLVQGHKLKLSTVVFVFIGVQAVLVGGYMAYKKRIKNGPKKYL